MHRTYLLQLLEKYQPWNAEERESYQKICSFVQETPLCFERSWEAGHVTAAAWLVNRDNSAALLMHHGKLGIWVQLGGHCDGESNVLAVALKEAQEESGISAIAPASTSIFDLDVHLIPETKKEKAHYHYDVRFLLQVQSDEQPVKNNESLALQWISRDINSIPVTGGSIMRMHEKWRALKG